MADDFILNASDPVVRAAIARHSYPYTLDEVRRVLATQSMDVYHRDLMEWLLSLVTPDHSAFERPFLLDHLKDTK